MSFGELDEETSRIAAGLQEIGVRSGMRLALLVRPSIDFISLVFSLFKAGAVTILIDPGMGRRNLVRCLDEAVEILHFVPRGHELSDELLLRVVAGVDFRDGSELGV